MMRWYIVTLVIASTMGAIWSVRRGARSPGEASRLEQPTSSKQGIAISLSNGDSAEAQSLQKKAENPSPTPPSEHTEIDPNRLKAKWQSIAAELDNESLNARISELTAAIDGQVQGIATTPLSIDETTQLKENLIANAELRLKRMHRMIQKFEEDQ